MSIPQTPSPLSAILAAKTYNAAWFSGATKEAQITAAIAAAATDGALYVYVPASMLPYTASAVTFNTTVRMIREGGDPSTIDVRAYGAAGNGIADDTSALVAAFAAGSEIVATVGTYLYTNTLTNPVNTPKTIRGEGIGVTIFLYTGTGIGMKFVGVKNGSSYGQIHLEDFTVKSNNAAGSDAGIEFSGSNAFNVLSKIKVTGAFKYGFVLDQTEVTTLENCIGENGALPSGGIIPNSINYWWVNGPDRVLGTSTGFTNVITMRRCQANNATYGLVDDGGGEHSYFGNNFNQNSWPVRIAGVTGLVMIGNTYETTLQVAIANVLIINTTLAGAVVGGCIGGVLEGNNYEGALVVGSSCMLMFAGDWSEGFSIQGEILGFTLGRTAGIDVTKLRWSEIGPVKDVDATHFTYTGVHNDANGNVLFPPNPSSLSPLEHTFGRTGISYKFYDIVKTKASAAGGAGFNTPHGVAPSAPVDGDWWTTTAGVFVRINGVTKTVTLT